MIPNNERELNYSKVKTYRDCPYLFKLKYVEGKREGLSPATSLGVSIHRTLEEYHANSNDPSELLKYYNRCWLGAGYSGAGEQMEYYLKGRNMLEVYEQNEYSRNTTVVATEREFMFDYEGWTFRGKIDRIDKYDIIFMGPPYRDIKNIPLSFSGPVLASVAKAQLLAPKGIIVLQHHKNETFEVPSPLEVYREEKYGDTLVHFLRHKADDTK